MAKWGTRGLRFIEAKTVNDIPARSKKKNKPKLFTRESVANARGAISSILQHGTIQRISLVPKFFNYA